MAPIDRLLQHCRIVNIRGHSYRMRLHTDLSKVLQSPLQSAPIAARGAGNSQTQEKGKGGENHLMRLVTSTPEWDTFGRR